MNLRSSLSRLGIGRLVYHTWHRPIAAFNHTWREGGPFNVWLDTRCSRNMAAAARRLPCLSAPEKDAPEVCFLTGQRFWYQTAFCFWSLCSAAGQSLNVKFYDDGSFNKELRAECLRLFPGAHIVGSDEIAASLDEYLPDKNFPALRARRLVYPNLRKLTDCHVGNGNWRLVLDSDMLFFRKPSALLDWFGKPTLPLYMADVNDAYGYSLLLMESLTGHSIPSRVNVGICGLHSARIDWRKLEHWCSTLERTEGTSYYLEQGLIAMLLSGDDAECLPSADYRLMPDEAECLKPTAVLHHYVATSKRGYFRHAWKHVQPSV